jgi:hypothetical protein
MHHRPIATPICSPGSRQNTFDKSNALHVELWVRNEPHETIQASHMNLQANRQRAPHCTRPWPFMRLA